jgi:glycosyltransferase involved in cell wall biosynthesis
MIELSVVVPVFSEEKNILPFLERTVSVMNKLNLNYEIIFALDPSEDETENIIIKEASKNKNIKMISFSRRFGQPSATIAGLFESSGRYCVVIDVDLQDPPELIQSLYERILSDNSYDVVMAKRKARKGETFIKKIFAASGYYLINKMTDIKIPKNTGDFRIMSRRVVDEIKKLNETHGFLRGLVSFVGFKQTFIEYERDARFKGKGNYNKYFGSIKIGMNGLFGFTSKPLVLMSTLGFVFAFISFFLGLWYVIQKLLGVNLTPGLPTTVLVITFFSGVQLLGMGLLGEYISRIYDEVKRRPLYIIDKKINFNK